MIKSKHLYPDGYGNNSQVFVVRQGLTYSVTFCCNCINPYGYQSFNGNWDIEGLNDCMGTFFPFIEWEIIDNQLVIQNQNFPSCDILDSIGIIAVNCDNWDGIRLGFTNSKEFFEWLFEHNGINPIIINAKSEYFELVTTDSTVSTDNEISICQYDLYKQGFAYDTTNELVEYLIGKNEWEFLQRVDR